MKQSEIEISFSIESYDEKTTENCQKWLSCRKLLSLQTTEDIDPKFSYHKWQIWVNFLSTQSILTTLVKVFSI